METGANTGKVEKKKKKEQSRSSRQVVRNKPGKKNGWGAQRGMENCRYETKKGKVMGGRGRDSRNKQIKKKQENAAEPASGKNSRRPGGGS